MMEIFVLLEDALGLYDDKEHPPNDSGDSDPDEEIQDYQDKAGGAQ